MRLLIQSRKLRAWAAVLSGPAGGASGWRARLVARPWAVLALRQGTQSGHFLEAHLLGNDLVAIALHEQRAQGAAELQFPVARITRTGIGVDLREGHQHPVVFPNRLDSIRNLSIVFHGKLAPGAEDAVRRVLRRAHWMTSR